jgi:hypothetical protein
MLARFPSVMGVDIVVAAFLRRARRGRRGGGSRAGNRTVGVTRVATSGLGGDHRWAMVNVGLFELVKLFVVRQVILLVRLATPFLAPGLQLFLGHVTVRIQEPKQLSLHSVDFRKTEHVLADDDPRFVRVGVVH